MVKLKQAVLVPKFQRETIFMLPALKISKKSLPMWSSICYNSSLLMFMLYISQFYIIICNNLVSKNLNVLPDVFIDKFLVTTLAGDSVVARRVFRSFPISLLSRTTWVDLVEIDMVDVTTLKMDIVSDT